MPRQNSQQCNQNSQHDLQHQGHQMSATKESHYDNHTEKDIPAGRPFDYRRFIAGLTLNNSKKGS